MARPFPPPMPLPKPSESDIASHNVELQIFIEDTNSLFKVYFNKYFHATLTEYYEYLSESLNLPNPSTFKLKKDVGTGTLEFVTDV